MRELAFTCSYTSAADVEGESPCGRRVSRRAGSEPKCLGHWVVEWLIGSFGGTKHASRTASLMYGFLCVQTAAGTLHAAFHPKPDEPAFLPLVLGLEAIYFGGLALAFFLEHPLGGRIWLFSTPIACTALVIYGKTELPDPLTVVPPGSSPASRVQDILFGAVFIVMALVLVASWSIFLLQYAQHDRAASWVRFVAELFVVLLVLMAVVLAIVSGGGQSSLLTWLMVGFGALVVARGTSRLKRLAEKIQVG